VSRDQHGGQQNDNIKCYLAQTNRFTELREITKEKDGTSSSKELEGNERNTCDAGAIEGDVPRKI
jgi:hypothetical protein